MSLSVSSFPEAPPKLVRRPKWQVPPSLKSSGRCLGTFLSKRSVPFLKGVGHFAKAHVKGSITRQRANVPPSRSISKHHPSFSRSSSIVIDIIPISNNGGCFSTASSEVDASSLNHTIEFSLSPTTSRAALSTPTITKDIRTISSTETVKAPYQSSHRPLVEDSPRTHEKGVQTSPIRKEHASDSEPHVSQPSDSENTTPLPISPSPATVTQSLAAPSTEGRRRSHSASAGVKASATKMVLLPTRPRYKSETAIGLPQPTTMISFNDPSSSSKRKDTSEDHMSQPLPATGRTHDTSESTSTKKQRQPQKRETKPKLARPRSAGASTKSASSGNKAVELPSLSVHTMLSMRSAGSRLSANGHRPRTAPPLRSFSLSATTLIPKSPSLVAVGPGPSSEDDASQQSPLPSSVDRGRWLRLAAVPHAESWERDGERQRRRPRTAPEAVLMASW